MLISVSITLSTCLHCEATDSGLSTFIVHHVPDNYPAFTDTHCTYPQMDDKSQLIWMAG